MGKPLDLINQRFGRLLVIEKTAERSADGSVKWKCRCDCGELSNVASLNLRNGHTSSCGCINREAFHGTVTHGHLRKGNKPAEYKVWGTMKDRCQNPNATKFADYGGRGISVCERWLSFANFYADMGPRPSKAHSIERKNNSGNYEPGNCRWATSKEQASNRRLRSNSRFVTLNGISKTVTQWAKELGISRGGIYQRLYSGDSPESALRF